MISENERKNWDRERESNTYTAFLVKGMTDMRNSVSSLFSAIDIVFTLEGFIIFLSPTIQEHLAKESEQLAKWQENASPMTREQVIGIVRKIMIELHNAGYFLGARNE